MLFKLINHYKYLILLILVVFFLCYLNYKPNTWLIGWDNHLPEFNFSVAFSRDFTSAWRENRGLGIVSGMGHSSELVKNIILYILSFVLPLNFLRYFWQFLMLLLGPLGFYYFVVRILFNKGIHLEVKHLLGFLGALFYLFNLVTLQTFYTPLETFTTLYGFLPWLLTFSVQFIQHQKRRYLLSFSIVSILATGIGFTITLYFTYLFFLFFVLSFVLYKQLKINFKVSILNYIFIFLCSIAINSFWLFPNLYFVFSKGNVVEESTINRLSSQDILLKNQSTSFLDLVTSLRGYAFEATDYDYSFQRYTFIYNPWLDHLHSNYVSIISITIFFIILIGLYYCLIYKPDYYLLWILSFIFSIFILLSERPPFGFIFSFLQESVPFFREAFRSPFTKYSIQALFSYSILFTFGIYFLLRKLKSFLKFLFSFLIISLLVVFMFPLFDGNLFYSKVRLQIPPSYFDLFNWSSTADVSDRILYLPIYDFWSWRYHTWGYVGSGFLRYGVKQPLLDRSFDVWSPYNESAYWEISTALYSHDFSKFKNLLNKYNIKYIIFDKTVYVPDIVESNQYLYFEYLNEAFSEDTSFNKVRDFGFDLSLYNYERTIEGNAVATFSDYIKTNKLDPRMYLDPIYDSNIPYVSGASDLEYQYLFPNWFDVTTSSPILKSSEYVSFTSISTHSGLLKVPFDRIANSLIPIDLKYSFYNNKLTIKGYPKFPEIYINNSLLPFPYDREYLIFDDFVSSNEVVTIVDDIYMNTIKNNTEGFLGNSYFDIAEGINISLYSKGLSSNLIGLMEESVIDSCGNTRDTTYFSKNITPGISAEFSFSGTGFCSTSKSIYMAASNYYLVSLEKKSTNLNTSFCLIAKNKSDCINATSIDNFSDSDSSNLLYSSFYAPSGVYDLKLNFSSYSSYLSSNIHISSIDLIELSLLQTAQFTFPNNFSVFETPVNLGDSIKIVIPIQESSSRYVISDFKTATPLKDTFFHTNVNRIPLKYSYLGYIEGRNLQGSMPSISVRDYTSSKRLSVIPLNFTYNLDFSTFFFKPPLIENKNNGISLVLDLDKVFGISSESVFKNLIFFPIPYDFLSKVFVYSGNTLSNDSYVSSSGSSVSTMPSRQSIYKYTINNIQDDLVVLYQSFDKGWLAICGRELCDAEHVVFNNWANAWIFNEKVPEDITIIFWPQYLQYFGYLLLLVPVYILFRIQSPKKHLVRENVSGPHKH